MPRPRKDCGPRPGSESTVRSTNPRPIRVSADVWTRNSNFVWGDSLLQSRWVGWKVHKCNQFSKCFHFVSIFRITVTIKPFYLLTTHLRELLKLITRVPRISVDNWMKFSCCKIQVGHVYGLIQKAHRKSENYLVQHFWCARKQYHKIVLSGRQPLLSTITSYSSVACGVVR